MAAVGFGEKVYTAAKIVALVEALADEGISPEQALHGTGLSSEDMYAVGAKVSINQILNCCRNALALSHDTQLPFKVGSRFHISTYGMYGYAMLSSSDFRRTMDFAVRYHALAMPLTTISFEETSHWGIWTIDPISHPKSDARLYRFQIEMQIATHLCLQRDLMGAAFAPNQISFAYPCPLGFRSPAEFSDCLVRFDQPANQIVFDAKWLDDAARLGNRTTHPIALELCEDLLLALWRQTGTAGKVRKILLEDLAQRPSLSVTAKRLRTTARTLRRKLDQEGTSYRQLLDELRQHIAMKYLRETEMTREDIAYALGYSDAANFRHAFRRWTAMSPTAFRHRAAQNDDETAKNILSSRG
ncbi:AraC family transcriptional regulator [Methylovirgula sp. 4M-Z18]|uniref:AraC family transcriptional regulator n=1 Tax=Methylovirgula sp. 4M-Z18 TaxID=2293567 RepID=UPI001314438D|nr:AraC family transcriptional regulator [Methylovirgula sp. 4M-Z18]